MSEMIDRVTQAIWQAHKDNLSLRMHEIYPLLARAAIEAMRKPTNAMWQPIETAPKDGSWILTFRPIEIGAAVNQARWQQTIFEDYEWGGRGWAFPENSQPTHWMPLPAPPTTA